MTATVSGFLQSCSAASTRLARPIRSIFVRPQVGQAIRLTPSFRSPAAFKMDLAASTSFTGSAVRETRMVSPMPIHSRPPMPMADLMTPMVSVPVSVTPRWSG